MMRMVLQPAQSYLYPLLGPDEARDLEGRWAFSGIRDDGEVLICGGLLEYWKNRDYLWACLSVYAAPHLITITRGVRKLLAEAPHERVEVAVDLEFEEGHRWARMLGLELETPRARKFMDNGADAALYVRIR
jgi:hypothetical protein